MLVEMTYSEGYTPKLKGALGHRNWRSAGRMTYAETTVPVKEAASGPGLERQVDLDLDVQR